MHSNREPVALQGSVWITVGGENFGGTGRVGLLAAIVEHGSITAAAKAIGMSYKAAWDAIDRMNQLAGAPLVERLAGGRGGGGTRLTPRGVQLIENFKLIEREHRRFIERLSSQSAGIADEALTLRNPAMKTSARNQFFGKVARVHRGAVNDEIELEIGGGQIIRATITHESTGMLELKPGAEAIALIKASAIILAAGDEGAAFSAGNRLRGTVTRIQPGAVNAEVTLELPAAGAVTAIVTADSLQAMQLAAGSPAAAIFNASSVILAVAG